MPLFESYDRRINKVNAALNTYGIKVYLSIIKAYK
jgi:hypothetical protein